MISQGTGSLHRICGELQEFKNYWLNIIKAKQGESWLYMNSLTDENAGTKEKNGVVYTTREVMLNSIHNYKHRILLANMGTEDLTKLSVEAAGSSFDSGDVVLDDYWTLKGKYDLSGFKGFGSKKRHESCEDQTGTW